MQITSSWNFTQTFHYISTWNSCFTWSEFASKAVLLPGKDRIHIFPILIQISLTISYMSSKFKRNKKMGFGYLHQKKLGFETTTSYMYMYCKKWYVANVNTDLLNLILQLYIFYSITSFSVCPDGLPTLLYNLFIKV